MKPIIREAVERQLSSLKVDLVRWDKTTSYYTERLSQAKNQLADREQEMEKHLATGEDLKLRIEALEEVLKGETHE